jgi:hypothetical protein
MAPAELSAPQDAPTPSRPECWQKHRAELRCGVQTTSADQVVAQLAAKLVLGDLLAEISRRWGTYEFVDHWQQGEFHHDTILRVPHATPELPGGYLVVATNCNGGVKEVLCLEAMPSRGGLWRARCPTSTEFQGDPPAILAQGRTEHWFDPCALLGPDARSEYLAECRVRQPGGGWMRKT